MSGSRYDSEVETYDHVPSHVKVMNSGLGQNRYLVQAATDHLEKLAAMAQVLQPNEVAALAERFPSVSQTWLRDLSQKPDSMAAARSASLRLPSVRGAQPSPRRKQPSAMRLFVQNTTHGGPPMTERAPVRGPRGPRRGGSNRPSPRHGHTVVDSRAEAHSHQVFEGHSFESASSTHRRLEEAQQGPRHSEEPAPGVPEFVYSPGGGSEIGYGAFGSSSVEDINPDGLWEANPAILAPATLLRAQPVELLFQRREQALDGLRGLLHSLSRVRGACHKLPTYVAKAFQSRLQHAIGWYRVTTCELVEKIAFDRRDKTPVLKKTPSGELRQVYEPYIVDGANVLLLIGRVDLAFAPLPAAADPLVVRMRR